MLSNIAMVFLAPLAFLLSIALASGSPLLFVLSLVLAWCVSWKLTKFRRDVSEITPVVFFGSLALMHGFMLFILTFLGPNPFLHGYNLYVVSKTPDLQTTTASCGEIEWRSYGYDKAILGSGGSIDIGVSGPKIEIIYVLEGYIDKNKVVSLAETINGTSPGFINITRKQVDANQPLFIYDLDGNVFTPTQAQDLINCFEQNRETLLTTIPLRIHSIIP